MAKKDTPYDVTKHMLVPKHSKLGEKDTAELLATYNITVRELPRILATDPAVQHLDVKEGDVIRIVRTSESAGDSVFYRRVTNA